MPILQALILGLVQGATEFLPISSSGHLVIVPFMFGWDEPTVAFDVAVHAGTLISVLWVFWDRVKPMLSSLRNRADAKSRHTLTLLLLGTLPAAVLGLALTDFLERSFERPVIVAFELGITGWLLFAGDRLVKEQQERVAEEVLAVRRASSRGQSAPEVRHLRGEDEIGSADAIFIGVAQAVSILPGISRSGATVVAALRNGITKEAAVSFSFLLSIPAIAGAILVKTPDIVSASAGGELGSMVVGMVTSAAAGVFAIRTFIRIFKRSGLRPFGFYCFALMALGLLTALARG